MDVRASSAMCWAALHTAVSQTQRTIRRPLPWLPRGPPPASEPASGGGGGNDIVTVVVVVVDDVRVPNPAKSMSAAGWSIISP